MKNQFTSHQIKVIALAGLLVGATNRVYGFVIDAVSGPDSLRMILGYISIVVVPIGIYIGLRRIRFVRSVPLSFLQSLFYGWSIAMISDLVLIVSKLGTILVFGMGYSGVADYVASGGPRNSLIWYAVLGLIYSSVIHFIVKHQFRNT